MKKIILMLLCILMLTALCSCEDAVLFAPLNETQSETVDPDKPVPEEIGLLGEDMAVEIYNKDNIVITADSFCTESDGDVVFTASVSNKSDKTISVALRYPEINGICSAEDSGWGEARKGDTITVKLDIDSDFLSFAGITTVDSLAFRYTVYNESGRTISDEENKYISFTSGNEDYEQIINTDGTAVIDTDDCQVIIQKHYDGKEGIDVIACFTNNSDKILKYQIHNAVINDISFDVNFLDTFIEIPSYSMTYYRFTIFASDLNRYGISSASDVSSMKISAAVYNTLDELIVSCESAEVEIQ